MRYNGIFRALLGAALVLALMVPAQGFAQTGTKDKTDPDIVPDADRAPTITSVQSFADRFDTLEVRWTEPSMVPDRPATGYTANPKIDEGPITGYRVYYSDEDFGPTGTPILNASFKDVGVGVSAEVTGLDPAPAALTTSGLLRETRWALGKPLRITMPGTVKLCRTTVAGSRDWSHGRTGRSDADGHLGCAVRRPCHPVDQEL